MLSDEINPSLDRPLEEYGAKSEAFHQNMANLLDTLSKNGWEVFLLPRGCVQDVRMLLHVASYMSRYPTIVNDTETTTAQEMDFTICVNLFDQH